jgi:hypothetical protein
LGKLKVAKALVNNALGAVIEPINRDAITPFLSFQSLKIHYLPPQNTPEKGGLAHSMKNSFQLSNE